MTLLTIILVLWGASALINHARDRKRQAAVAAMKKAEDQRRADAARLRAEWKERERQAREEYLRVRRLEREQERLAEEQERQAAQLEKHEKRISKLEHTVFVAKEEVEYQLTRIERLKKQIEAIELERDACVKDGPEYMKYESKLLSLERQVHSAEKQMWEANYKAESAEAELTA